MVSNSCHRDVHRIAQANIGEPDHCRQNLTLVRIAQRQIFVDVSQRLPRLPGNVEREIADPFGGPLRLYEAARDEMVEALPSLVAHLKTLIAPKRAG